MKTRINDLPADDFSEIAIGFNNVLNENVPQLSEQVFIVTEKDSVDSPTTESESNFSTYMTQEPTPDETPDEDNKEE